MNILLVKPKWFIKGGIYRMLDNIRFTPIHLGIIAALSEGHKVTVIDNDWDEIPFKDKFDLVGITSAEPLDDDRIEYFKNWLAAGNNGKMAVSSSLVNRPSLEKRTWPSASRFSREI